MKMPADKEDIVPFYQRELRRRGWKVSNKKFPFPDDTTYWFEKEVFTRQYYIREDYGVCLYVLEGGHVQINSHLVPTLVAAKVVEETNISVKTKIDAELVLVNVHLV